MTGPDLLTPDWPAPPGVRAVATTRHGGVSQGAYRALNLGTHVGDDPAAVAENRARLRASAGLPSEPVWLRQVHGVRVADLDRGVPAAEDHDAAISTTPGAVCAVLTADCLPVLLCAATGEQVAVAHAGWRGLAAGVLEAVITAMGCAPDGLLAWLGPCIGPAAFEIGPEVRSALLAADPGAGDAFTTGRGDRYHADLPALATRRLRTAGVRRIYPSDLCTYSMPERFFSHRRDGRCGRMASLIWRE